MNLFSAPPSPWRRLGLRLALVVLALDQLSKWIVVSPLSLPSIRQMVLVPIFSLTWAQNYGISLGLFSAESPWQRWLLVALTALVATGVGLWMWREQTKGDVVALSLILGGAMGNILDRIRFGYVVDFADLHFGDFRPFMIFNLADAAITIGVLLLVARALLVREKGPTGDK
jgi:signal peptidase II